MAATSQSVAALALEPVPFWPDMPYGMGLGHSGTAVAVDSSDRVFVYNRGKVAVLIFSKDGEHLGGWTPEGSIRPHGITITDDDVYLVDDTAHTIERRTLDGELLLRIGDPGRSSKPQSGIPFNRPTDLAVDPLTKDLYISDGYANSRVHQYDYDGHFIRSWGRPGNGPGEFSLPHGVVVTRDGAVLVCDRENHRVQAFDRDGTYLYEWNAHRPTCIREYRGNFILAELTPPPIQGGVPNLGSCFKVVTAKGEVLGRFGNPLPGQDADQFVGPHGIGSDSEGSVYVAETSNSWREAHPETVVEGFVTLRKWRSTTVPESRNE